jgi:DNA-binding MarR family transcriptional regulator
MLLCGQQQGVGAMTDVIPRELDNALGFNVYRVALLFRRELMRALQDYALTPEQWQVLIALTQSGQSLEQHELGELTLRDRHTLSRMLARMERDGWIERRPDRRDGRVVRVRSTARARAEVKAVRARLWEHFTPILGVLTPAEQSGLLTLLKRIRRHLEPDASPARDDTAGLDTPPPEEPAS